MKGKKPTLDNVVPMKGDTYRPTPPAPEWFPHPEAVEAWEHLAPVMIAKNRLEPHHEDLFAAYCVAVGDFIRFSGELALTGNYYEVKTRNGLQEKKRAAWGQRQDALATMQRIGALYGMSPVDEARLGNGGQGSFLEELEKAMRGGAS
ncbi:Phage terminase, small subunit [Pseudooceanicola antarcticus]|uniref:Phage terminase small subunit P27 family n=1 Tax=Pseudooceanicola antarcticus TaxID=1247613 RepID=A0A285J526_9RHOB|nr:P27 family phage terminase small subunit [Pseudooceanicola antarcticus]PJE26822.1 phage terminase small subunit P27 family [Pseudooceanicola antarcticus]SNY55384.1 Phage terminase, small subunit [Pseudooceanicola antarcticus]